MRYSTQLDCLKKAREQLVHARYWLERMAGFGDVPIPSSFLKTEEDVDELIKKIETRCDDVKNKFEIGNGLLFGTHILVWNPDKPKHQTLQRMFVMSPNREFDAPHISREMFDIMNKVLGCECFSYEEPFDLFVIEGKKIIRKLEGKGNRN